MGVAGVCAGKDGTKRHHAALVDLRRVERVPLRARFDARRLCEAQRKRGRGARGRDGPEAFDRAAAAGPDRCCVCHQPRIAEVGHCRRGVREAALPRRGIAQAHDQLQRTGLGPPDALVVCRRHARTRDRRKEADLAAGVDRERIERAERQARWEPRCLLARKGEVADLHALARCVMSRAKTQQHTHRTSCDHRGPSAKA